MVTLVQFVSSFVPAEQGGGAMAGSRVANLEDWG
jgi:hypothetical protein